MEQSNSNFTTLIISLLQVVVGCVAAILVLCPYIMLWTYLLDYAYNSILRPMIMQYGYSLPIIPYLHWFCIYVVIGAFRGAFSGSKLWHKDTSKYKKVSTFYFNRCATAICLLVFMWVLKLICF